MISRRNIPLLLYSIVAKWNSVFQIEFDYGGQFLN